MIFIGIITAVIACCIDIAIEEGSEVKFNFLKKQVDKCVEDGCLIVPFLYWILCNVVPVLIGCLLVVYIEVSIYYIFI
jgi:chloride channel 7